MAYLRTATVKPIHHRAQRCTTTYIVAIMLALLVAGWAQGLRAETRYVSDELTIPLRTGSSVKYRIVKFLESGTRLQVHEASENGEYSRVTTEDGDEGWVLSSKLMTRPSARDRIVVVSNKLEQTVEQKKKLQEKISELESSNRKLEQELQNSRSQLASLQSEHEELKRVTANPRAMAQENNILKAKLDSVTLQNSQLTQENEALRQDETKEWFILGASVSLGSLILGLIITRIPWRKRNSWGDL